MAGLVHREHFVDRHEWYPPCRCVVVCTAPYIPEILTTPLSHATRRGLAGLSPTPEWARAWRFC